MEHEAVMDLKDCKRILEGKGHNLQTVKKADNSANIAHLECITCNKKFDIFCIPSSNFNKIHVGFSVHRHEDFEITQENLKSINCK